MRKILLPMLVLIAWTTSICAQTKQEQANAIVLDYLKKEAIQFYFLYVNNNIPSEEGITLTTQSEETVKIKYPCWAYYVHDNVTRALSSQRYLFVKEDTGSLLEIITHNDFEPGDLPVSWTEVKMPTGFAEPTGNSNKSLYPNPVDDWLTLPYFEKSTRIEIRDLIGSCLFSKLISGKDAGQLNVSFLNAGIYIVCVYNETGKVYYKMIKK